MTEAQIQGYQVKEFVPNVVLLQPGQRVAPDRQLEFSLPQSSDHTCFIQIEKLKELILRVWSAIEELNSQGLTESEKLATAIKIVTSELIALNPYLVSGVYPTVMRSIGQRLGYPQSYGFLEYGVKIRRSLGLPPFIGCQTRATAEQEAVVDSIKSAIDCVSLLSTVDFSFGTKLGELGETIRKSTKSLEYELALVKGGINLAKNHLGRTKRAHDNILKGLDNMINVLLEVYNHLSDFELSASETLNSEFSGLKLQTLNIQNLIAKVPTQDIAAIIQEVNTLFNNDVDKSDELESEKLDTFLQSIESVIRGLEDFQKYFDQNLAPITRFAAGKDEDPEKISYPVARWILLAHRSPVIEFLANLANLLRLYERHDKTLPQIFEEYEDQIRRTAEEGLRFLNTNQDFARFLFGGKYPNVCNALTIISKANTAALRNRSGAESRVDVAFVELKTSLTEALGGFRHESVEFNNSRRNEQYSIDSMYQPYSEALATWVLAKWLSALTFYVRAIEDGKVVVRILRFGELISSALDLSAQISGVISVKHNDDSHRVVREKIDKLRQGDSTSIQELLPRASNFCPYSLLLNLSLRYTGRLKGVVANTENSSNEA